MADRLVRAIVTLPRLNNINADSITNTWHFDCDDGNTEANCAQVIVDDLLTPFYQAVDAYLSDIISSTATVDLYDMRQDTPRVPFASDTITLTLGASTALPAEVALCLSYHAAISSGDNARRRRGRIYLGPLRTTTVEEAGSDGRPPAAMLTAIAAAATTMVAGAPLFSGSAKWSLFSPSTLEDGSTLDDAFFDVTGGWIDNAFDIQRRRGSEATSRTTF